MLFPVIPKQSKTKNKNNKILQYMLLGNLLLYKISDRYPGIQICRFDRNLLEKKNNDKNKQNKETIKHGGHYHF